MRRLIILTALVLGACGRTVDYSEARGLIATHCAACHVVPGVPEAKGRVGPSLAGIARQQILAGHFANDRMIMAEWITHPQAMLPGSAMPDTGLTDQQGAEIAAYLATLD
jgi:cytochrome c2